MYTYPEQVIASFDDQATEDVFHGRNTKAARSIPQRIWDVARRKLDMINAAHAVEDLRVPPNNRLEALKGDLAGFFSIRVNDQYRIVFEFSDGQASKVRVTDYH